MEGHVVVRILSLLLLNLCMWVPMAVMGRTGNITASNSRPSLVSVGSLFTLNSVIGRSVHPAIVAAIDDVNSDSTVLSGTKLNLILGDTNCSGFVGTIEGNRYIPKLVLMNKMIHLFLVYSFCNENLFLHWLLLVLDRVVSSFWGIKPVTNLTGDGS